jgi:hypothetical protein
VSEAHEFLFAMQLSDEPHFDSMVIELARAVLLYVGYQAPAIDELGDVLSRAIAKGASNGHRRCEVRFRAHEGEMQIVVSYAGGGEWRTTRALP